ncbi:hypothetical protein BaRGS_00002874, partial [Batillaria attramentaria]
GVDAAVAIFPGLVTSTSTFWLLTAAASGLLPPPATPTVSPTQRCLPVPQPVASRWGVDAAVAIFPGLVTSTSTFWLLTAAASGLLPPPATPTVSPTQRCLPVPQPVASRWGVDAAVTIFPGLVTSTSTFWLLTAAASGLPPPPATPTVSPTQRCLPVPQPAASRWGVDAAVAIFPGLVTSTSTFWLLTAAASGLPPPPATPTVSPTQRCLPVPQPVASRWGVDAAVAIFPGLVTSTSTFWLLTAAASGLPPPPATPTVSPTQRCLPVPQPVASRWVKKAM